MQNTNVFVRGWENVKSILHLSPMQMTLHMQWGNQWLSGDCNKH
jgi:hypothetical protein